MVHPSFREDKILRARTQNQENPTLNVQNSLGDMQSIDGKILTFLLLDPLSLIAGGGCFASLMIFSDDDISAVE